MDEQHIDWRHVASLQRKHYGDALTKLAQLLQRSGLDDFAQLTLRIRETYGLGNYNLNLIQSPQEIRGTLKPSADLDTLEAEILRILNNPKFKKYSYSEIFDKSAYYFGNSLWTIVYKRLLKNGVIKAEGKGAGRKYWIE